MTTVNAYQRFKALLPQTTRFTLTVDAINSDGTSLGTTRDGGKVKVLGSSITVGQKAWVENGRIVGEAPNLTEYIEFI